jgi:hypothetical protein
MRRGWVVLLVWMLSFAGVAGASEKPADPKDYPLMLHVKKSEYVGGQFNLYVTVDGKALVLMTSGDQHWTFFGPGALVAPGDYRARISQESVSKRGGMLQRKYEFLWADGTRETYDLAGISE